MNETTPSVGSAEWDTAVSDIATEFQRALRWPPFNSAHEGFAVLLEEVDELKAHVWTRQPDRDLHDMRHEAVQVAAMAVRFLVDVMYAGRGRK